MLCGSPSPRNRAAISILASLLDSQPDPFDVLPDGIVFVDPFGIIRRVNQRVLDLTGYVEDELVGQTVEVLMPPALRGRHVGHFTRYLEQPVVRSIASRSRLELHRRDGLVTPVDVALAPLEVGTTTWVVASIRAIGHGALSPATASETRRAAELARRHDQLEQHLVRIAREVRASGVLGPSPLTDVAEDPLRFLSPRQRVVVERLVRGERVPSIAAALYVSQSTVRNTLSVVFKKFRVHSQAQLLSLLAETHVTSSRTSAVSIVARVASDQSEECP